MPEEKKKCKCDNPKPNGDVKVGYYEGSYKICENCGGRIWD